MTPYNGIGDDDEGDDCCCINLSGGGSGHGSNGDYRGENNVPFQGGAGLASFDHRQWDTDRFISPFTPKSDQIQISPAASPEI